MAPDARASSSSATCSWDGPVYEFFLTARSAHYTTFVVMLARLYGASSDAFTLARLYDLAATNPNPTGRALAEIRADLDVAIPVGRRLYLIRSKGSRRIDKTPTRDIYKEASLKYDETGDLLEQSKRIFADLSYHIDGSRENFSFSAAKAFQELLDFISAE